MRDDAFYNELVHAHGNSRVHRSDAGGIPHKALPTAPCAAAKPMHLWLQHELLCLACGFSQRGRFCTSLAGAPVHPPA